MAANSDCDCAGSRTRVRVESSFSSAGIGAGAGWIRRADRGGLSSGTLAQRPSGLAMEQCNTPRDGGNTSVGGGDSAGVWRAPILLHLPLATRTATEVVGCDSSLPRP